MRVPPVRVLLLVTVASVAGVATAPPALAGASCLGEPATIVGTAGPDELVGTPERDVIQAKNGDDEVRSLSGRDKVCLGAGDDTLLAGRGFDFGLGGGGDDLMKGGSQSDHFFGERGDDVLRGQGGSDQLTGEEGFDRAIGGPGVDGCDAEVERSCEFDPGDWAHEPQAREDDRQPEGWSIASRRKGSGSRGEPSERQRVLPVMGRAGLCLDGPVARGLGLLRLGGERVRVLPR